MAEQNNEDFSDCPEMDYFMDESKSDIVFIVEGQRVPALKLILSMKSKVFRAMFSEKFKESKDKEVVIKDTTFDAFKTFIQFLFCDQLVLKDRQDFKMIEEIYKLGDRYEVSKLIKRIGAHFMSMTFTSDNIKSISEIAFNYKIKDLMTKITEFIDNNYNSFVNKELKELIELNDSTHNKVLEMTVKKYLKVNNELIDVKSQLHQREQRIKQLDTKLFELSLSSYQRSGRVKAKENEEWDEWA